MYASQVVNAVLLPVHVVALLLLAGDHLVMGSHAWGKYALTLGWLFLGLIIVSIFALAADWLMALG